MEFYQSVFGGELTLSTFAEFHASEDPAEQDKIMHGMLDGRRRPDAHGSRHAERHGVRRGRRVLDLPERRRRAATARLLGRAVQRRRHHRAAGEGPWGDTFGMCTDKFGVNWMVNIAGTPATGANRRRDHAGSRPVIPITRSSSGASGAHRRRVRTALLGWPPARDRRTGRRSRGRPPATIRRPCTADRSPPPRPSRG